MIAKVKDLHDALPDCPALENLLHRHRLDVP
jgi:hypothetical protein